LTRKRKARQENQTKIRPYNDIATASVQVGSVKFIGSKEPIDAKGG
jgi:hypothetical protein